MLYQLILDQFCSIYCLSCNQSTCKCLSIFKQPFMLISLPTQKQLLPLPESNQISLRDGSHTTVTAGNFLICFPYHFLFTSCSDHTLSSSLIFLFLLGTAQLTSPQEVFYTHTHTHTRALLNLNLVHILILLISYIKKFSTSCQSPPPLSFGRVGRQGIGIVLLLFGWLACETNSLFVRFLFLFLYLCLRNAIFIQQLLVPILFFFICYAGTMHIMIAQPLKNLSFLSGRGENQYKLR